MGDEYDCVRGITVTERHAVIMNTSSQCLPLVEYDADMIDMVTEACPNNNLIYRYHFCLQKLIDQFFNDGNMSQIARPRKIARQLQQDHRNSLSISAMTASSSSSSRRELSTFRAC